MGFFSAVKSVAKKATKVTTAVATGGASLAVPKIAAKAPLPSVAKTVLKAADPVKAAVGTAKAAAKGATKVGSFQGNALTTLHLTSVANQLNVKKLVTDPKGYATQAISGYKQDVAFAGQFYGQVKKGDFKGIAAQGAAETVKAFGGSKALQDKAAAVGGVAGATYGALKSSGKFDKGVSAFQQDGMNGLLGMGKEALLSEVDKQIKGAAKGGDGAIGAAPFGTPPPTDIPTADKVGAIAASSSSMGSTLIAATQQTPAAGAGAATPAGGIIGALLKILFGG